MIRELFSIGSFSISPFGVFLVLAFFAAFLQLRANMDRLGLGEEEDPSTIVFWAGFGGIVGGKIYYALLYGDLSLIFDRAGIVWYGGLIGGTLMAVWAIKRAGLPLVRTVDAAVPGLAIGYAVGRIGCLLVGDDYGRPTDLPWGLKFEHGLPPTTAGSLRSQFGADIPPSIPDDQLLAVHPTQIYETLGATVIWLISLWLLFRLRLRPGLVFLFTMGMLAIERFLVEFVRLKDDRFFGALSLAQVISLTILVLVLILAARLRPWTTPATDPARAPV